MMKKLLIASAALLAGTILNAAVKLPAIFSDHAVLARRAKVPVFGTAAPGEKVTVTLDRYKAETTAGKDGRWRVDLNLADSPEGPFELKVNDLTVKDVLVGEVWLCSGQSNMAFPMAGAIGLNEEKKNPPGKRFRCFLLNNPAADEPQTDCRGRWVYAEPATIPYFPAVGYFFGKELLANKIGPVGLIKSAQGGSRIECWMSLESLKDLVPDALEKSRVKPRPKMWYRLPLLLFNSRLHPLIPYRLSGVVWYQGESNAASANRYAALFRAMIQDWRKRFEDPELPFFWCNLPSYRARSEKPDEPSNWAELRAAQTEVLSLPATGQAVLIDTGEIGNIHPRDKQPAGRRIAALALARVYGRKCPDAGPSMTAVVREGNSLRISFRDLHGGLRAAPVPEEYDISTSKKKRGKTVRLSPKTQLEGFALCGADGQWHWADRAVIEGDQVVISSEKVQAPCGVRYAWQNSPVCNLFNAAGFPAVPFQYKLDKAGAKGK